MFITTIKVDDELSLVKPNPERDGPLSVVWRSGPEGHKTQAAMGITPNDIRDRTLVEEQDIIQSFLDNPDEIAWMIEYQGRVVGGIEVPLKPTEHLRAPAIHIMIGDLAVRGKGIGKRSLRAVIDWLRHERHEPTLYTRHLVNNHASAGLLISLGFEKDGPTYTDVDGLIWQNVVLHG